MRCFPQSASRYYAPTWAGGEKISQERNYRNERGGCRKVTLEAGAPNFGQRGFFARVKKKVEGRGNLGGKKILEGKGKGAGSKAWALDRHRVCEKRSSSEKKKVT